MPLREKKNSNAMQFCKHLPYCIILIIFDTINTMVSSDLIDDII